jgi:hypothetical protein
MDLCEAGRKKAAKSTAERRCAVEERNSIQHLMTPIKHGEIHQHTAEQTTFGQAKEKARDQEPSITLDEPSTQ